MLSMCLGLRGFYIKSGQVSRREGVVSPVYIPSVLTREPVQFIGARGDFVPAEICERLAVLHDRVPPMGEAECRRLLAAELGCPPEEMFAEFDYAAPLGSASVAQVHRAQLAKGRGGATVAVKLQNASQLDKMDLDLKNIAAAAAFLERTELKFDLSTAVEELAKQVRLEFDFQREAETMRRIRRDLRSLPRVKIPKCIAATPKVIVMEVGPKLGEGVQGLTTRSQVLGRPATEGAACRPDPEAAAAALEAVAAEHYRGKFGGDSEQRVRD